MPARSVVVAFTLFLLTALWASLAIELRHDQSSVLDAARTNTATIARAYEEHILGTLRLLDQMLLRIERQYEQTGIAPDLAQSLRDASQVDTGAAVVGILNPGGDLIATNVPHDASATRNDDRDYFLAHKTHAASGLYVSRPLTGRVSGKQVIVLSRALTASDGAFLGVAFVSFDLRYLSGFFNDLAISKESSFAVVGTDLIVRDMILGTGRRPDLIGKSVTGSQLPRELAQTPNGEYETVSAFDAVPRVFSYRTLPDYSLVVLAGLGVSDVLAAYHERERWLVIAALVLSFVIVGVAALQLRQLKFQSTSERELRQAQELLIEAQRAARLGFALYDAPTKRVTWSESVRDLRGVIGESPTTLDAALQYTVPEDLERYLEARTRAYAERRSFTIDVRVRKPDGTISWEQRLILPHFNAKGELTSVLMVMQDITERKENELKLELSERALRESEAQRVEAARVGRTGHIVTHENERLTYWSETVFEMRGIAPTGPLTFEEGAKYVHPDDRARWAAARDNAAATGRDYVLDLRILRGDGTLGWERITGRPRFDPAGKFTGIIATTRDVTEAKQAEESLRRSEERFRALIEQSTDLVTIVAPDLATVTYRSPSQRDVLGETNIEAVRPFGHERLHPDDIPEVLETLQRIAKEPGLRANGRSRIRHGNGTWRTIAWSARNAMDVPGVDGLIINARDITEILTLENRLSQAQKMEAIGQVAGGIAHDFNNILGAILGYAGFLTQDLPEGEAPHGFAQRIVKASERARDLVQQILAFSRGTSVERQALDLCRLVADSRDLIGPTLPQSSKLQFHADAEGLIANVNAAQVTQVLLNLCVNASHALAGRPGTITVTVARVAIEDGAPPTIRDAAWPDDDAAQDGQVFIGSLETGGDYALITVADTGNGIEPDTLQHIFDPFFTTKGRGSGTGLGLYVVRSIVAAYEGACAVASRPGAGTIFAIYLPIDRKAVACAETRSAEPRTRGKERILVLDDEVMITDMMATGLTRQGYDVQAVNDPTEAVRLFVESAEAWDAVISDIAMPMMDGVAVLRAVKAVRPSIPVILCTGYTEDGTEERALAEGADALLHKPITTTAIAAVMRRLFAKAPPGEAA